MEKKVLIGCPTYISHWYCIDKYLEAVRALDYDNYDLLLVDNSPDDSLFNELKQKGVNVEKVKYCEPARERIIRSRNLLRERAIQGGYDYFLSLEQDVIVPPDLLKRLLSHGKEIIAAYYGNKVLVTARHKTTGEIRKIVINLPLIYVKASEGKIKRANPSEVLHKGLIEVGAMGIGCVLISTDVLKKIKFRYEPDKKAFDDMHFCSDAKKLGYKLFLDSDVVVEHLHKEWKDIEK